MSAIPDPLRPSLASSRRGDWRQFLLNEWSLFLLAAALSVIIWLIVRDQVLKDHVVPGVQVRLRVDGANRDRVAAVFTAGESSKVNLHLTCSVRERDQVVEQLKKDGWAVEMLVREISGDRRSLNREIDRYQWKFAAERILTRVEPDTPKGYVLRVATRNVAIEAPATIPTAAQLEAEHRLKASIEVSPPLIPIPLPIGARDDSLVPDPIDLTKLLDQANGPIPLTLTFDRWRTNPKLDPAEAAYRRQVELPTVKAGVRLIELGERAITNELHINLDREKYESRFNRERVDGVPPVGALTFKGLLKGPRAVLDALEEAANEKRGTWIWTVHVKDRNDLVQKLAEWEKTRDQPDAPWGVTVTAEIAWVPVKGFQDSRVRFVPATTQDTIDLEVRLRPE